MTSPDRLAAAPLSASTSRLGEHARAAAETSMAYWSAVEAVRIVTPSEISASLPVERVVAGDAAVAAVEDDDLVLRR